MRYFLFGKKMELVYCALIGEIQKILKEKAVEATKQEKKGERKKKPKPEEQEGMPQHQRCPPEKRRGDRNPECHEEQQKDVA
jgi:hypothetical protein